MRAVDKTKLTQISAADIVASSTPNPVFYLGLNLYVDQIRESLALCDEKVQVSSPQGSYQIKRFVYRCVLAPLSFSSELQTDSPRFGSGSCRINAGAIIGGTGGAGGAGPGGVDIVHEDWSGTVVVETDGTTEHATTLIARCSSTVPTPWRILRDKSRPGKLWLRYALRLASLRKEELMDPRAGPFSTTNALRDRFWIPPVALYPHPLLLIPFPLPPSLYPFVGRRLLDGGRLAEEFSAFPAHSCSSSYYTSPATRVVSSSRSHSDGAALSRWATGTDSK